MVVTVTKNDLKKIAYAYPRYHLGAIFQEIIEIYDNGKSYTLNDLLTLGGERVIKDNPAIYLTEDEYLRQPQNCREKHPLKKVGNVYEFLPRRIYKYERYLVPLFYSAIICHEVTDKRVIVMVTDKLHHHYNKIKNTPLFSWHGATEEQTSKAEQILKNNSYEV